MASELSLKLKAQRQKIEAGTEKFESEQEASTADCQRISPRKFPKTEDSPEKQGLPKVASPPRTRRLSNPREFKDTMVKRRSLTDTKGQVFEKEKETEKADVASAVPKESFSQGKPDSVVAAECTKTKKPVVVDDADNISAEGPAMVIPEDPACKVYVGNLAWKTKFKSLKEHMTKSGGEIAFAGILGEDGSVDGYGWSRGFGFVIYETREEAKAAIQKMNGTELDGRKITVDLWSEEEMSEEEKSAKRRARSKSQERWKSKSEWKSNSDGRWKSRNDDDWYWNFIDHLSGRRRWASSRSRQYRSERSDPKVCAWVGNINYRAGWKDLKDHMEPAGDVVWSEILTRGGAQGGRSKGMGFLEYKTPEQVDEAVNSLNGTEMQGRQIVVDHWTTRSSSKERR